MSLVKRKLILLFCLNFDFSYDYYFCNIKTWEFSFIKTKERIHSSSVKDTWPEGQKPCSLPPSAAVTMTVEEDAFLSAKPLVLFPGPPPYPLCLRQIPSSRFLVSWTDEYPETQLLSWAAQRKTDKFWAWCTVGESSLHQISEEYLPLKLPPSWCMWRHKGGEEMFKSHS